MDVSRAAELLKNPLASETIIAYSPRAEARWPPSRHPDDRRQAVHIAVEKTTMRLPGQRRLTIAGK